MAEYIDKVAFNYAIREAVKEYPNSFYNGLEVARQIAHDFPTADVRLVVRGKWKRIEDDFGKYDRCSNCGKEYFFGPIVTMHFCPHCGADMRGGKLMAETFQTIAALMWMALSVVAFIEIRKWNKSFSDLYESIKRQLVDEEES